MYGMCPPEISKNDVLDLNGETGPENWSTVGGVDSTRFTSRHKYVGDMGGDTEKLRRKLSAAWARMQAEEAENRICANACGVGYHEKEMSSCSRHRNFILGNDGVHTSTTDGTTITSFSETVGLGDTALSNSFGNDRDGLVSAAVQSPAAHGDRDSTVFGDISLKSRFPFVDALLLDKKILRPEQAKKGAKVGPHAAQSHPGTCHAEDVYGTEKVVPRADSCEQHSDCGDSSSGKYCVDAALAAYPSA